MKKNNQSQNMALTILASMVILLFFSGFAIAEDEAKEQTSELEPMTVIATKTPKTTLDAPGSVSVITDEEIQSFISEHPYKALSRTEGVWPRAYRGLADFWSRPVMRGHRALVQVDGINWYDYGYYVHTGSIPMPDVERIDVVRGPFSALYGTLAQTAVINYTTAIPVGTEIDASASYGDWDSRFYSFRFADRPFADGFFYSFSFKSRTSDGYETTPSYKNLSPVADSVDPSIQVVTGWEKDINPSDGKERYKIGHQGDNWYEDYGAFFKTGYEFSYDTKLWYSLNISEFEYGWRDGRSSLKDASGKTLYEGDAYVQDSGKTYALTLDPFNFTSDPKTKESIAHTLHFSHSVPDRFDITAVFGFNDKESATHYVGSSRHKVEDDYLAQADMTATFHFLNNKSLITFGFSGVQEEATVTDNNLSDPYDKDSTISVKEETSGENRTFGTFIQAEYSPTDYLTAYLGGRYDHWWGSDATYSNIDGEYIEYEDTDDGKFSPKISLVYRPAENGSVRASYGEAFTAPSLYYRTSVYYWEGGGTISVANPNPDLAPTTNQSWEIGTEWEFLERRIRFKTTYFENYFEDLIVNEDKTTTLEDGTILKERKRVNAEEAEVKGIETAVEAILPYNFKGGVFYAHNWSEYTKTQNASKKGWEVDETPTDMWSVWLGYYGKYLEAAVNYRYCDRIYDDEKNKAEETYGADDDYHLVDAKVTFKPADHVSVSLGVDNLFDEEYYEYYRGPGRYWLGTLSVSF